MGRRVPTRALPRARKDARTTEAGAAAVEFALILPVLVMLIFGVITTGLTYNDKLSIANAAREGARIGSALPYTSTPDNPTATPADWIASVQQRVQDVYFNSANALTDDQICVRLIQWDGSAWSAVPNTSSASVATGCGPVPANPVTTATNTCAVEVWVQKPAQIQLMVLPDINFQITAQAVSFYGRSVTGGCQAP